eukprot:gene18495-biopygen8405
MGRGRYHRPVDLSWTREPGKGWNSAMDDIQVITLCWLSGQLLSPVRLRRLQQTEEVRPQGGGHKEEVRPQGGGEATKEDHRTQSRPG